MTPQEVEDTLQQLELEIGMEVFEEGAERDDAQAYRQDPEYQEGMIIPKGESIDVWYEQTDTSDTNILNTDTLETNTPEQNER